MPNYEKTKKKLHYLTNKNLENKKELSRLDAEATKIQSIYFNKNISKYYIFNAIKLSNINTFTELTIDLWNFKEDYLSYINFVGIIYGNSGLPTFTFNGLNYSFFKVTDNYYTLKFTGFYFNSYYTGYFTLYFTINNLKEYNE